MNIETLFKRSVIAAAVASFALVTAPASADRDDDRDERKVYIMHTGDLHGDLDPHPNARDDATGLMEGGLARAATVIKKLKRKHKGKIVWGHTGDTIQGSAIATYTQGKALVDVWDALGPDLFATGNWEYVYGLYRYQQLFGTDADIKPILPGEEAQMFMIPEDKSGTVYQGFNPDRAMKTDQNGETRRWATIAANAYYNGINPGPGVVAKPAGTYFTDPYFVKEVNGIKIGFIGCTTNRGPQVVSSAVTKGVSFSNCAGAIKFPQNRPINWDQAGANSANRDQASEVKDLTGGDNAAKAKPGSTVKGYATVNEILKFTVVLRTAEGQVAKYTDGGGNEVTLMKTPTEAWTGEGVDLVVLMSEAGIPENIWNAETMVMPEGFRFPEIILSSDTHERTRVPVAVTNPDGNKTVIIEEGEDAMQVGLLELEFKNGKLDEWEWKRYDIDETVPVDSEIADLIEDAKAPFMTASAGGDWQEGDEFLNPFNGYTLTKPLNFAMGNTEIVLERNRFSYEHDPEGTGADNPEGVFKMPADVEGTLHDVFTDAFRVLMDTDVGAIRGFRYNNTIMPGPITIDDVYHSLTIGAMVASANIPFSPAAEEADIDGDGVTCGGYAGNPDPKLNECHRMAWPRSLIMEAELAANGSQRPEIPQWSGGWLFNYSGINFDFNVYNGNFNGLGKHQKRRIENATLVNSDGTPRATDWTGMVSYASYYYDADFNRINRNQVISAGKCKTLNETAPGLKDGAYDRSCADKVDMKILVKTGKAYGAPMAWVTSQQYGAARAAARMGDDYTVDGYSVFPLDVVEAFGRYVSSDGNDVDGIITIKDLRNGSPTDVQVQGLGADGGITKASFDPTFPRYNLLDQLQDGRAEFGFGIIQPMRGATKTPVNGPADTPSDEGDF